MKTLDISAVSHFSPKRQRGATLIETLISILLMSIGLLGIAGLQLSAAGYQRSSWSTHRVAEITNDLAERMRSNPTGATNGDYNYVEDYATGKSATFTSNDCRNPSKTCGTAQIAQDDIAAFIEKTQTILPQGSAQITGAMTSGFTVTTMYFDKDFINPATNALLTSATCAAQTGMDWRNCCPAAANVPAGVRCRRFNIVP